MFVIFEVLPPVVHILDRDFGVISSPPGRIRPQNTFSAKVRFKGVVIGDKLGIRAVSGCATMTRNA